MDHGLKRRWSEIDDSDDEEPSLGKRVLPVANLPNDFNGEPMDGLQYLFTVRRDARALPRFSRVPNPYEINEETMERPPLVGSSRTRHHALPSEEWRVVFIQRFKNFRKNSVQSTIHVGIPAQPKKVMPDKKERGAWWAFLSGRPESEWNPPKKPKAMKVQRQKFQGGGMRAFSEGTDSHPAQTYRLNEDGEVELTTSGASTTFLPTPTGTPAPEPGPSITSTEQKGASNPSSMTHGPREPTPLLLKSIDHRYALHLLMYFAHWINLHLEQPQQSTSRITETHARWIFALLSRVDDYVSADETSQLRNLARACVGLLNRLLSPSHGDSEENVCSAIGMMNGTHMSAGSCWMVITAVTGIWGQRDLWSDAEDMLKGFN